MTFFGLHWPDALILLAYIVGVLVVGRWLSHQVKGENDFFLAGRRLGKWFQFFLNFGNMTDPSQATVISSSVYSEGAGGVWLGLIPIFMSPAYWFIPVWYRRVRVTTTADVFDDRFGRRFLAAFYSIITLSVGIVAIGQGNIVAYKTLAPIMVKAPAVYTPRERQRMVDYREYVTLRDARKHATPTPAQKVRFEQLQDLYNRGILLPYISYLSPIPFYLSSTALIAIFLALGGLQASALVDGLQTILTIAISFMIVPFGLSRIGGFHGLHHRLASWMFQVFGAANASEYTWYSIAAFLLVSIIGTVGATAAMAVNGSATTENAARLGAVTGGITKRFVTMAWCMAGLIAIALFGANLSDPDQTWGSLVGALLPVGLIGTMIVGILGGKLASLGASSIGSSALMVRNIYRPLVPGKSERHYMIVARATIPATLIFGAAIAYYLNSAVAILKFLIVILVVWGAPIFLIFMWRRLTEMAVRVQMIACLCFIAIIPAVVSSVPALRRAPSLTVMTRGTSQERPVAVFFEDPGVAHVNPGDLKSPLEGIGSFRVEVYLVSLFGVNVTKFTSAGLTTIRYLVDSFLPFLILIAVSYVTPQTDPERVKRFYARMKTPVLADPKEDALAVEASYAQPGRFDHTKLFPNSNWEFTKWNWVDTWGFLATCASVVVILLAFKALLSFGG